MMIGTVKRKIAEEKVRHATCEHCNEKDTLILTVYSKFFMLKILPFVLGKTTELNCSYCKKGYGQGDLIQKSTSSTIKDIKDDANHPWYLYIGYGLLVLGFLIGILNDMQ